MKTWTADEICEVISQEIKVIDKRRDEYIQKNGYIHRDVLNAYAFQISGLVGLYSKFKLDGQKH